nr:hypothetical protein [Bacteroidales bacterium]
KFVKLDSYFSRLKDTLEYRKIGENLYEKLDALAFPEGSTRYVRHDQVPAETIIATKQLIQKKYGKTAIVLFNLEYYQLRKYTEDEIKAFFD